MSIRKKAVVIIALSTMLGLGAAAVADDSVMIRIYNDDADDILLSVYDMNVQPPEMVVTNQRINGFAWIPVFVTAGAMGKGHVRWVARTDDSSFQTCGYREMDGVADDGLVDVSASAGCRDNRR